MRIPRILPFLLLVALAVAPVRLLGGEAMAMPHHAGIATTGEHCAPDGQPAGDGERPFSKANCMMACAALAPATTPSAERLPTSRMTQPLVKAPGLAGLTPEAATPPPRLG